MADKKKTWQQRTAELRKAAVLDILRRPAGESENEAILRVTAKYTGRNLPGRKQLKLSNSTMRRIWYNWKRNPSDAVFDLHFSDSVNQSVLQPWISHLFTDYATHHKLTAAQAYRALKAATPDLPFSLRTVQRHISAADRARIAKALTLRKKINDLEQELKTLTEGGAR